MVEKQRDEEFAERRERRRKQQEEEEETRRKKEEERRTREPQTAAGPENSQSQEGSGLAADEMDVVVSENSAVTAAGNVMESSRHSISDTVSRLTQDLANAIGGRVSGGPAGSQLAGLGADPGSGASGLLSSLSELLPSGSGAAVATSGAASTLNSVLQSLSASYHHHQGSGGAAAGPQETSTPIEHVSGSDGLPPTFHFSTPPPPFPLLPIRFNSAPSAPAEAVNSSGGGGSGVEPGSLPDALGPLSPSPDQDIATTTGAVNPSVELLLQQQQAEPGDVSMTSVAEEVDAAIGQGAGGNEGAAQQPPIVVSSEEQLSESAQEQENHDHEDTVAGDQAATIPTEPSTEEEPVTRAGEERAGETVGGATAAGVESDFSDILGNIEIPEGVDPSFLAALPEDMRQEVLEEQRRLARARHQPAPPPPLLAAHQSGLMAEVNPEFLAALPPNIQEEVLAQQRLEQQRQNAARLDPAAPVDPGEFLQNLPPSLRQSLLADMEESQISALPAELAAEAQTLRRDFEQRNRAIMHERFFNHVNSHAGQTLSSILRNTVNRISGHYAIHHTTGGGGGPARSVWARSIGGRGGAGHQHSAAVMAAANSAKFKGRQLLDHEGLSCLLILLFIDDAKLNTTRLHRILRNLCYHAPTRDWVVKCLLSILEKANACSPDSAAHLMLAVDPASSSSSSQPPVKMKRSSSSKVGAGSSSNSGGGGSTSWLNISMDAALGFRANVFQVTRPGSGGPNSGGKKSSHVIHSSSIHVHPQAAPVVCKHTLELLISLAKSFPIHFLPSRESREEAGPAAGSSSSEAARTPGKGASKQPEFWDTLLKLDRECWSSRKGKSVVRSHSAVGAASGSGGHANKSADHHEEDGQRAGPGGSSAFGQLLSMLASPVIRRSSLLTDKLLRLLSLISLGQPDVLRRLDEAEKERTGAPGAAVVAGGSSSLQPTATAANSSLNIDKTLREDQIQLAVEVLTSKACSEEGLEDVTALLLNLSYGGCRTSEAILRLLLAGARELGHVVSGHVSALLGELADIKAAGGLPALPEEDESARQRGVLADRFTKESVVLTAPAKPKAGGSELQLSSMSALTNKTSSQSFFLRVLKVIIQLRDSALLAIKKLLKANKEARSLLETLESIQSSLAREEEEEEEAEAKDEEETKEEEGGNIEAASETTAAASQV